MTKKPGQKKQKNPRAKKRQIIVLEDGAGNYYEIARAVFERSRVDARDKPALKRHLKNVPPGCAYISGPSIPGSVAAPKFIGGRQLHYAGYLVKSTKVKR